MRRSKNVLEHVDWTIVLIYVLMVLAGWLNIYAAVYNESHSSIFDLTQNYGKQLLWIGVSGVLAFIILLVDSRFYEVFSYIIYGLVLCLLLFVLVFARRVAGSASWIDIGSFKLQPAEFAKFATALAASRYLSGMNVNINRIKDKIKAGTILLVPMGLVLAQNDTGSALVFLSFVLVLFREGLPGSILVWGLITVIVFVISLLFQPLTIWIIIGVLTILCVYLFRKQTKMIITVVGIAILAVGMNISVGYIFTNILEPHQKTRINVLLGKETDLKGSGYNVNQSKIAIGSGGFFGKGFLQGTQTKFDFVPEQSTDFIFCTVGEEWGFLGSAVIIFGYLFLLYKIIDSAERQRSAFSRIYGYCVASILFFHFTINIGMTIGLLPVIGIPLPFFSYGGSSLLAFTALLFVFIKLDSNRLLILR